MQFPTSSKRNAQVLRFSFILSSCLFVSLFTLAQVTLTFRLLNGYILVPNAPVNKGKPTLFVFEQADTFAGVFSSMSAPAAATTSRRPDRSASPTPNFDKEMVIGVTVPLTSKSPRLSISKVFVQDSTLTVRYTNVTDTSKNAPTYTSPPTLVLAIPKQTVLRTRLVENGKVVQTIKKREE